MNLETWIVNNFYCRIKITGFLLPVATVRRTIRINFYFKMEVFDGKFRKGN
jgi:hypothetical protein